VVGLLQNPVQKVRNRENWLMSSSSQALGTQKGKKLALRIFDRFCNENYHTKNCEPIIEELQKTKSVDQALDVLQSWINWSNGKNQPNTLRVYFSNVNQYLYYRGIKIDGREIKTLKFPKLIKRKNYPLHLEEIQRIISPVKYSKKSMYLALISSGMRISECVMIQRKHLDLSLDRIKITIPAEFTKSKEERITFLSKEAEKYNIKHIRSLGDDELVWGISSNSDYNVSQEDRNFARYCDNVGLDMRYLSGTRKITLHSFRSYFITKGNKIDDAGFGHAIAGHEHYMKSYDRYTDEELLELYLKLEPELYVFDLTIKDKKIRDLESSNKRISELERNMANIKEHLERIKKED